MNQKLLHLAKEKRPAYSVRERGAVLPKQLVYEAKNLSITSGRRFHAKGMPGTDNSHRRPPPRTSHLCQTNSQNHVQELSSNGLVPKPVNFNEQGSICCYCFRNILRGQRIPTHFNDGSAIGRVKIVKMLAEFGDLGWDEPM